MTAPPTKEQIKAMADRAEARAHGHGDSTAKDILAAALSEGEISAEVAKLAALPIGVYESSRVEAAKRLHMRASVLDVLVEAKRAKPTKEKTDFLPH